MSEEANRHETQPAKLPAARYDEVKARAQRILDQRGRPPYTPMVWQQSFDDTPYHRTTVSEDEALVLSEFVTYWMPYLVEKPATPPADGPWIPWEGGVCPVPGEVLVDVRFRSGKSPELSRTQRASYWVWTHSGEEDDIVAYKVLS